MDLAESDTADSLEELEDLLLFIREFSKVFDDGKSPSHIHRFNFIKT